MTDVKRVRSAQQKALRNERARKKRAANPDAARAYARQYRIRNLARLRERERRLRGLNRESIREQTRNYRERNREKLRPYFRERARIRRSNNREPDRVYARKYRAKNRARILSKRRAHSVAARDILGRKHCVLCLRSKPLHGFGLDGGFKDGRRRECIECRRVLARAYFKNNRAKIREKIRLRMETDVSYRLLTVIRDRLRTAIRKHKLRSGKPCRKAATHVDLLGCSVGDLMIYLESKFEPGMTWMNHGIGAGKWQIDHIMPCAIFDMTNPEHQRRCFHFSNLQPLWAVENSAKGARFHPAQVDLTKSWICDKD